MIDLWTRIEMAVAGNEEEINTVNTRYDRKKEEIKRRNAQKLLKMQKLVKLNFVPTNKV